MKIAGKCYDEVPQPPEELKPMLKTLYETFLEELDGAEGDMTVKEYFVMWWEEIVCK